MRFHALAEVGIDPDTTPVDRLPLRGLTTLAMQDSDDADYIVEGSYLDPHDHPDFEGY